MLLKGVLLFSVGGLGGLAGLSVGGRIIGVCSVIGLGEAGFGDAGIGVGVGSVSSGPAAVGEVNRPPGPRAAPIPVPTGSARWGCLRSGRPRSGGLWLSVPRAPVQWLA
ncbi:hypothetical protein GCM10023080_062420 [Streptomyces pseudoechinosporeus]